MTRAGDKQDIGVMRKRAKRYVYRFFVDRQRSDPGYWWEYPGCFESWVDNDEFSMYPTEGLEFPRTMFEWEKLHCPWYLDSDRWAETFDQFEKSAMKTLSKGQTPEPVLVESKMAASTIVDESTKKMEDLALSILANIDSSRKMKPKKTTSGKAESRETSTSEYVFFFLDSF